ncbi:peroxin 8 [Plectosphaerella plurivora]|uniref:Peroxin 8 n=1 Tax=Plectosphaerella plurivora TaxID=936078 RepID=A0A9P8VBF7_9PEZI|nr:peroxin 8 [Plectosphaerella plurivora]
MPADRMLNAVLHLYQSIHDDRKTDQILGTTTNLLTTLSNPLNIGVLTSQLLVAPALWHRRRDNHNRLRAPLRVLGAYNAAAARVRADEKANARHRGPRQGGGIRSDDWAAAVARGADDRSPRWRHLLVLAGLLTGMEGGGDSQTGSLSSGLRATLERAVVTAANLALATAAADSRADPAVPSAIVLALNYAFPLLSEYNRGEINADALLPLAIDALIGPDGFEHAAFLGAIDADLKEVGPQLHWGLEAASFARLQDLETKPMMGGIGPLSKLAAFTIERATDAGAVMAALETLLAFSGELLGRWQTNRLSAIDQSEEAVCLTPDALQTTPALWETLRKTLYSNVTILQSIVARSLLDPSLRNDIIAPKVASNVLRALRNLYFISSRNSNSQFQVYSFTYLTSLDILARFPDASVTFLSSTKPRDPGAAPGHPRYHPLNRTLDLFYLNVAEHLPLNIPSPACEDLIVQPATAYLTQSGPPSHLTVELFEAAHSAVLSTLSCPHNSALTVKLVPFYIDTLFASFPSYISTRQFRVAFKTIMQIVSPPFPIAATHPYLSETLLEMVRFRALGAATAPLPETPDAASSDAAPAPQYVVSEQSSLVLTLIDALPYLPLPLVQEWMTVTAQTMNAITDPDMRQPVKDRFLDVLVSGEMDVERAAIGVAWWGTSGGRELVVAGGPQLAPLMSGAIVEDERASKL